MAVHPVQTPCQPKFSAHTRNAGHGFTLVEILIASGLVVLVAAGVFSIYIMCLNVWHSTSIKMRATREANMAVARLVYGPGTNNGLRSASANNLDLSEDTDGSWSLVFSNQFEGVQRIDYDAQTGNIDFGPDSSYPSDRQHISGNVAASSVAYTNNGIAFTLTIALSEGRFSASNQVSTFVKLRNL